MTSTLGIHRQIPRNLVGLISRSVVVAYRLTDAKLLGSSERALLTVSDFPQRLEGENCGPATRRLPDFAQQTSFFQ